MAHAARSHHGLLSLLDADGESRPVEYALVAVTVLLGALSAATAYFHHLHLLTSWSGLVGVVTGGWGQMISTTTQERFLLVIGLGAAALGLLLGSAHGGLFGGVIG